MYIRRKMYSIGYDENDLYEVEQRAFSNGFACAERLFADVNGISVSRLSEEPNYSKDLEDENWFKRAWKYGGLTKEAQRRNAGKIKEYMELKNALGYANETEEKAIKNKLKAMLGGEGGKSLTADEKKLRKALNKMKATRAGMIGAGVLGSGALGYGAYKAAQD